MKPLVSIIIPLYNSEKYIHDTLYSCLNQTYKNFEIIIVDDGSIDRSSEIVNSMNDNRILYFKIPNGGPCKARNFGISKSSGQLIQFLDADDILHEEKLELQMLQYLKYGDNYIYSGTMGYIIGDEKKLEIGFDFYYSNLKREEYFNRMFDNFGKYYTTGMWLVPAKLVKITAGWNEEVLINNDGEYFTRLILNSEGIIYSEGSIFFYRRDVPQSVSKAFNSKKVYESWLYSYKCYVKSFQQFLDMRASHELGRKALSVYYCNSFPNYPDLLLQCKNEIRNLGYSSPSPHGGLVFKSISMLLGVDLALKIRLFKQRGRLKFNALMN
ncbi:glycosyltransferase involved in cell wall biosynthesis [Gillisia mitskevichiae]|uniref:Glycosyltransferase involved in cell wall biosynthesis n=1 Tax=Gillisia mitskevichiae TaxID=270921 RepID=A0A495PVZ8_9FLAO|nr:glycosyltransferase family A protein [Gillisia mitskevichiae]RKS53950.1 glycosyltransferase involved in cell wall biosynthesis [Gillisia mitskevichiae]